MSAQTQMLQQANLLSGRQAIMLAIVALHALIISALMAMRIMPDAQPPPSTIIANFAPPPEITVPPPPKIMVPIAPSPFMTPDVPAPMVNIPAAEIAMPFVPPATSGPVVASPPQSGAGEIVAPSIPGTALQYRAIRSADDYYPASSLRLQEEGAAIVQVCVAPSGKLAGNPVIQTSSGSSRLDAAALRWAREALRFTPATQGGVPVSACKGFRVHFTLH